jgi:uncharacterized protein with HEPN domain
MRKRSVAPRLADIVEAIEHIRSVLKGVALEDFESDWQKRWLVERGLEIISEASRHLPDDIKLRHSEIPWQKVAGIGNVLRHNYERIAPDVLWKLVQDDMPAFDAVCREELTAALIREEDK